MALLWRRRCSTFPVVYSFSRARMYSNQYLTKHLLPSMSPRYRVQWKVSFSRLASKEDRSLPIAQSEEVAASETSRNESKRSTDSMRSQ